MARPGSWPECGTVAADGGGTSAVWGECKGSGSKPYLAAVHLDGGEGPAYKCSCPSRKIPCKHVLALLALWSGGGVEERDEKPEWVNSWLSGRAARKQRAAAAAATPVDPEKAAATLRAREETVAAGIEELRVWLNDQVDSGLAEVPRLEYGHWDRMAKRLVDAKAAGAAGLVTMLPQRGGGEHWPDRVLERLGLLHLLVDGYLSREGLDERTRAVLRSRVGISTRTEEVLSSGERVKDTWRVLGHREGLTPDGMRLLRTWLRGAESDRWALTLTFSRPGESPEPPFRGGIEVEGELAFHPDGLRAVRTDAMTERPVSCPKGGDVEAALDSYALALAADPWLEAWPVVLEAAAPAREERWYLVDRNGAALPMDTATLWSHLAVTGGRPATVAAEWSPRTGLTPMTLWDEDGKATVL
ncbi:SWIM zinc finger family protein [Nocardiopsis alba]|uniref:SWIM zinc finger family protein n=1 Tax=Nocardiopsis alba TaxID=53437 RepID=UPI0033A2ECA9